MRVVQFQIVANLLFPKRQGLAQSYPFLINAYVRALFCKCREFLLATFLKSTTL